MLGVAPVWPPWPLELSGDSEPQSQLPWILDGHGVGQVGFMFQQLH